MLNRITLALLGVAKVLAVLGATVAMSDPSAAEVRRDPKYGTDGKGNPTTEDCTVITDSDPQAAVDDASDGDIAIDIGPFEFG